jgi:hypothetical protein
VGGQYVGQVGEIGNIGNIGNIGKRGKRPVKMSSATLPAQRRASRRSRS